MWTRNLDRIVDLTGRAQGSGSHFLLDPGVNFRDGAPNPAADALMNPPPPPVPAKMK